MVRAKSGTHLGNQCATRFAGTGKALTKIGLGGKCKNEKKRL